MQKKYEIEYGGAKEDAFLRAAVVAAAELTAEDQAHGKILWASRYRPSHSLSSTSSSSRRCERLEQHCVLSEVRLLPTLEGITNVA
jgi:hypothetical protein